MSQKSDDSIESFFRKAVVQQDKTFMERDWHSMEKMLDAQATTIGLQQAAKTRVVIKAIALVAVITSLFFVGTETQTEQNIVQMQAAVGMARPRIAVKKESPIADLHSSERSCADVEMKKTASVNSFATTRVSNATSNSFEKNLARRKAKSFDAAVSPNKVAELSISSIPIAKGSSEQNQTVVTDARNFENNVLQSAPTDQLTVEQAVGQIDADSIQDNELVAESEQNKMQEALKDSRAPKIIITGLLSPDFSTTSLTKYTKPSGVFGVLVGYKISRRFTIMTGMTKSLKKYEGYGNEYSPPDGYWQNRTNGVVPDEVEGRCGIIEVPVLVQFDVLQRDKSRLFISGGVSSYFMRSENYQYTFHEPNPGAANSWTAKEPSQYLFKIGHLSAGYDRMIGKNFSVGIEPFLKVPFQGIGWTDINLYTTGAYINVRYIILRTQQ